MPKGLLIKNTKTIIRYDAQAALDDKRFEVIEDVAAYLAKGKAKKPRKPAAPKPLATKKATPAPEPDDTELADLLEGIDTSGEENSG
jgi:hypothetical protein